MLVRDRMTPNPVTIGRNTTFNDAFALMKRNSFRRLPVVDAHGRLVGIVVQKDLLRASPSSATSLSVYEINYLLSELTIDQVMSQPVITATEDLPLEEAARVMLDHKIGCLPVLRGEELVGIITETDIFKALAEVLGGGQRSVRVTLCVPDRPGALARVATLLAERGVNIRSVATFHGGRTDCIAVTMRVVNITREELAQVLDAEAIPVLNWWEPANGTREVPAASA